MTIRYKCEACGAVMKIRDEKAGLRGHCPTCKAVFTVPQPETDTPQADASNSPTTAPAARSSRPQGTGKPASSPAKEPTAKRPPAESPASDDDEFDPVAFLTDTPPAASAAPAAKTGKKPATASPAARATKPATSDAPPAEPEPGDEDFDPVSFLLEDGTAAPGRSQPAAASPPKPSPGPGSGGPASAPASTPAPAPSRPGSAPASSGSAPASPGSAAARGPAPSDAAAAAARATEKLMPGSKAAAEQAAAAAAEGGTVRSAGLPPEKPKRRINWKAVARDLHRVRFKIITWVVITIGIYLGMSAVFRERMELPPLGQVSGTVTLDGEPLAGARVVFSSITPTVDGGYNRKIRARSATATTDAQGHYELTYLDDIKGTVLGRNRVQISKINEKGQEIIPPDYGTESKVLRTIKEGHQVIDIDVKTK